MRSRRTSSSPPLLLLSFQDIITAVTAIFLLCTLSLTLDLLKRGTAATPSPEEQRNDQLAKRLEAAQQRRSELQAECDTCARMLTEYSGKGLAGLQTQRESLRERVADLEGKLLALQSRAREKEAHVQQAKSESEQAAADMRQDIEATHRSAEQDRRRTEELQRSNSLIYNPSPDTARRTWLVDLAETRICITPVDNPGGRLELAADMDALGGGPFRGWLRQCSQDQDLIMVLIRPSGATRWDVVEPLLHGGRYAFGYDLIPEDRQVVVHR